MVKDPVFVGSDVSKRWMKKACFPSTPLGVECGEEQNEETAEKPHKCRD